MPTPEEIVRHSDPDPDEDPWVAGPPATEEVAVVPYDPAWPDRFRRIAEELRTALGDRLLAIDHVGSTSVPGLAAKDIIDVDVTVQDSRDEESYVPALEAIGYRLTIREPSFHEHRCLQRDQPSANVHVWSPGSPEAVRHGIFRDWLREHPEDRALYEDAKARAVPGSHDVREYNHRKQDVIRAIYDRAFRAAGLL